MATTVDDHRQAEDEVAGPPSFGCLTEARNHRE